MDHDEHSDLRIEVANEKHLRYASEISRTMEESAHVRGTGIAKRSPEILVKYMLEGHAVVATDANGRWAGFCYLSVWDSGKFVANSGLIVAPEFREQGLAKKLKTKVFELSRKKYPEASIIGITTSPAVMKVNTALGFHATSFSEVTQDSKFWDGCKSCVNHDILQRTGRKLCLCTAMRFDVDMTESAVLNRPSFIVDEEFH